MSRILKRPPGAGEEEPLVVVGRLLGLADHLAARPRRGRAPYEARASKMLGGTWPITPASLRELQGMVRRDLGRPGTPRVYREALEEVESRLDGAELPAAVSARLGSWGQVVVGEKRQRAELDQALDA
ncbi:hypothetical protein [Streptodolium elevatio]|uniref:Uncharacterized protein n=1 Tax=Streptodolium elevatio TaxID=3157996 RepID=A0ABV3DGR0_9ACTN